MGGTIKGKVRAIGYAALLLAAGTILGPVAVAAVASLSPQHGAYGESIEARRLVNAYRSRMSPMRLFLSLAPTPDGKECGYDPNTLFPGIFSDARADHNRTLSSQYFDGYQQLTFWKNDNEGQRFIADITNWIDQNISQYEIAFLRRCIESTMFSDHCMKRVELFGDAVERFPDTDAERRRKERERVIICGYIDGIAVRQRIPLAQLDTRQKE